VTSQESISEEFERILAPIHDIFDELRGKRLFLTGGTGFFGRWLLESVVWANQKYGPNIEVTVLSRNPNKFKESAPHLAKDPAIRFNAGDIRNFIFPKEDFSHIIHGASTTAEETFRGQDPLVKFNTIVEGTRRILDFSVECGADRFLYLSSGSAYGQQPPEMTHMLESYCGAPMTTDLNFDRSALGEGKRAAELLCTIYSYKYRIETIVARCFSFIGPHLPLDIHYAIGNFIRDGILKQPIIVQGDGTPLRSYLFAVDLAVWLWTILLRGKAGQAYNVGSDQAVSITELAALVSQCFSPASEFQILKKTIIGQPIDRYIPDIQLAKRELGLMVYTSLQNAIEKTVEWNYQRGRKG